MSDIPKLNACLVLCRLRCPLLLIVWSNGFQAYEISLPASEADVFPPNFSQDHLVAAGTSLSNLMIVGHRCLTILILNVVSLFFSLV